MEHQKQVQISILQKHSHLVSIQFYLIFKCMNSFIYLFSSTDSGNFQMIPSLFKIKILALR